MGVRLVARLGGDALAQITYDLLAAHSQRLVEHLRLTSGEPGAYTLVISPPGRDRSFLMFAGPNDAFGPEDLPESLLRQTRLLHLGYPPLMRRLYADGGETLAAILSKARAAGATTSLDLAMPDPAAASGRADWRAILGRALPFVDVFAPSFEELAFMLQRERFEALQRRVGPEGVLDAMHWLDARALAEESLELGARIVVIKLGHRGLYLRTASDLRGMGRGAPANAALWRNRELWAPSFQVQVVGTVGAGDATIAGLLTGLLRGLPPEPALINAAAVGACNVEAADATSGVRSWDETLRRIALGWPQRREHPLAFDDAGAPLAPTGPASDPSVFAGKRDRASGPR
jgi:sugar/nucleoside kinase (ribokinase family)